MEEVWQTFRGEPELHVNGDGRFDTPGHSATYGSYTMMEADSSKIVVFSLIKVVQHRLVRLAPQLSLSFIRSLTQNFYSCSG